MTCALTVCVYHLLQKCTEAPGRLRASVLPKCSLSSLHNDMGPRTLCAVITVTELQRVATLGCYAMQLVRPHSGIPDAF